MDDSAYLQGLVRYYNEARLPANPGWAAQFRAEVDRDPNHWAHAMIRDLQAWVRGQRVLEIACGMGRWTQYAVETAEFVRATDAAPNLLECARGLNLPAERVEFQCVDAFDLDRVTGEFDCAMHLNFFNHLPDTLAKRFQRMLHQRLGDGKRVFVAGQQYSQNWKKQMYGKADS